MSRRALHRLLEETNAAELPIAVTGLADISKKYFVGRIWQTIVAKIKSQWPSTLEEWDKFQDELSAAQLLNECEYFEHFGTRFPEPASAVAFALKHDAPSILPAAFYYLSFTRLDHNYGEIERYDGDRACAEHLSAARWKLLDLPTLRRFLVGKEFLLHTFKNGLDFVASEMKSAFHVDNSDQTGTNAHASCAKAMRQMGRELISVALHKVHVSDINCLAILDGLREYVAEQGLCDTCNEKVRDVLERQREIIWERLPVWFEVE